MKKSILFLALLCITSFSYSQKVDTLNVYSLSMKKTITALVIIPDQNIKKNIPSVYILHGYSGYPARTLKQDIPSLLTLCREMQTIFRCHSV
jgi:hypothetical protein